MELWSPVGLVPGTLPALMLLTELPRSAHEDDGET